MKVSGYVIATTGGALPEVVGDAGILVPPGRADALAATIKQLLNDKQAQQRMSEAGRKRVEEKLKRNSVGSKQPEKRSRSTKRY